MNKSELNRPKVTDYAVVLLGKMCDVCLHHGSYSPDGSTKRADGPAEGMPDDGTAGPAAALESLCDAQERLGIEQRAAAVRLSVSAYLRNVGLAYQVKSLLDQEQLLKLIRVNGDQGRLGGLLKRWLTARPGEGASGFNVRKLLREIEAEQARLKTLLTFFYLG